MARRKRLTAVVGATLAALALCTPAGCGSLLPSGAGSVVVQFVWLPNGDIFLERMTMDVDSIERRSPADAEATEVSIGDVAHLLGCEPSVPNLFVAPDGGLGLEYACDNRTHLIEWTADGRLRELGSLPSEWGLPSTLAGSRLSGLVHGYFTSASGGRCVGIRRVADGELATPFQPVNLRGTSFPVSPDRGADCRAALGTVGGVVADIRRDGSGVAFLLTTPAGMPPSTGPAVTESIGYVWWWPREAAAPTQVGPSLHDVDHIAISPAGDVAVLSGLHRSEGAALLDMDSGQVKTIISRRPRNVRFSPDGTRLAYIDESGQLAFQALG